MSSTSKWGGLAARRWLAALTGIAGVGGACFVFLRYTAQHEWYGRYGNGLAVFALAAIASMFLSATIAAVFVSKRARSLVGISVPTLGVAAFAIGSAVAFQHHKPTAAAADAALQSGDLERARIEAQALVIFGSTRAMVRAFSTKFTSREPRHGAAHTNSWRSSVRTGVTANVRKRLFRYSKKLERGRCMSSTLLEISSL